MVVYLHTHSGCRVEGRDLVPVLMDKFAVCLFDFCGYGHSEGEYSTLGINEQADIFSIMTHLRDIEGFRHFYLWGRSMGAVSAIRFCYNAKGKGCRAMILDSPFSEVRTMIVDVMTSHSSIPEFLIRTALLPMGATLKNKTGVDVLENNPFEMVPNLEVPCLFMVGTEDKISKPERVREMYEQYGCLKGVKRKRLHTFQGEHASFRSEETVEIAVKFLQEDWNKVLRMKKVEQKPIFDEPPVIKNSAFGRAFSEFDEDSLFTKAKNIEKLIAESRKPRTKQKKSNVIVRVGSSFRMSMGLLDDKRGGGKFNSNCSIEEISEKPIIPSKLKMSANIKLSSSNIASPLLNNHL